MHVYEYLISCHPFNPWYWCIGIHWKKSNPIYNASQMNCIKENLNYHQILHVISYTRIVCKECIAKLPDFSAIPLRSLFISPYTCYVMSSTTCVSFKPSQTKARTFRHMMMYIFEWRVVADEQDLANIPFSGNRDDLLQAPRRRSKCVIWKPFHRHNSDTCELPRWRTDIAVVVVVSRGSRCCVKRCCCAVVDTGGSSMVSSFAKTKTYLQYSIQIQYPPHTRAHTTSL